MLFLIYLLTCSAPVLSFLFILKQWLVVKFKFYHLYDFCACANKRISSCSITSRCHYMMFMLFSNKTFSKSDLISFENHSQQHFDLVLWLWRSRKAKEAQYMVIDYPWKQSFKDILCVGSARSHSTANVFSKWYHDVHPNHRHLNIPLKKWCHEKHIVYNAKFLKQL